jgi:hypothetical protein
VTTPVESAAGAGALESVESIVATVATWRAVWQAWPMSWAQSQLFEDVALGASVSVPVLAQQP